MLLVSLVWGCVWAPTMALYDGVLVNETKARGFDYGSLRVWSSVAFILRHVDLRPGGRPLSARPGCSMSAALGIVCLLPLALLLPAARRSARGAAKHAPFGILDLFRSRPFLLFMIAAGFCQSSHAVLYSFGTLTWRAAGLVRRHDQPAVGPERRRRDPADDGQRLADEADRRHRPDRARRWSAASCAGPAWPSRPSCRRWSCCRRCTPAPSPPAISAPWPSSSAPCRATARRSARASIMRSAPGPRRR